MTEITLCARFARYKLSCNYLVANKNTYHPHVMLLANDQHYNMASNSVLSEVISEEKLVEIWPDHPCLYDVRSADFKDRDKRHKALEEIAMAVNHNGNNIFMNIQ